MQSHLSHAAKPRSELWRTMLGMVLVAFVYVGLNNLIFGALAGVLGAEKYSAFRQLIRTDSSPWAALVQLLSIGLMICALLPVLRFLHLRALPSVIGPIGPALRDFLRVSCAVFLLMLAIAFLPPWEQGPPLRDGLPMRLWLSLLPLSLVAILVQTTAEEFVFRGYFQQQLAARFRSPLIWLGVPSVLFGIGHYNPQDFGDNALAVSVWAGLFGLSLADLTARAGNVGPAIAVHFMNNLSAILLAALPGPMSGLALWLIDISPEQAHAMQTLLPVDFAIVGVTWLAARLAIRR